MLIFGVLFETNLAILPIIGGGGPKVPPTKKRKLLGFAYYFLGNPDFFAKKNISVFPSEGGEGGGGTLHILAASPLPDVSVPG